MRQPAPCLALGSIVALTCGCYGVEGSAKARAANELDCPADKITVERRRDLSEDTVDVSACGQTARYTCPPQREQALPRTCVREPVE